MIIPETVSATVALHLVQTRHELAYVVAELESLPALSARGKTLRGKRDRLIPELDTWAYLYGLVDPSTGGSP